MEADQYRRLQEVAYVNHEGAGIFSTCALMLIYPATVCFQQLFADATWKRLGPRVATFLADFGASVLPLTIAFSMPHTAWLAMATLLVASAALAALRAGSMTRLLSLMRIEAQAPSVLRKEGAYTPAFTHIDAAGKKLRFIAEYRAVVMLTTCIVILAVDFPSVFPRAHAKTEEYGFSLMDLGTGCIVCASAICSRAARGMAEQGHRSGALLRKLLSLWPLLAVGFVRLVVLQGIDYHVPTSEYGVHWNFFFTIAVVATVSTAMDWGPKASAAAGGALLFAYQLYLSVGGGAEYILHAPRRGLFSANREGILGCLGYLGIHWLSVGLGSLCTPPCSTQDAHALPRRLLLLAALGVGVAQVLDVWGMRASHRMCNLPYAALVLGVDALVLGLLAALDLYWPWPRRPMPHVYGGVQDSMLAAFMAANLLTGAVNVTMQPLLMPAWAALLVLAGHSFALSVPLCLLHARGKALKFW